MSLLYVTFSWQHLSKFYFFFHFYLQFLGLAFIKILFLHSLHEILSLQQTFIHIPLFILVLLELHTVTWFRRGLK